MNAEELRKYKAQLCEVACSVGKDEEGIIRQPRRCRVVWIVRDDQGIETIWNIIEFDIRGCFTIGGKFRGYIAKHFDEMKRNAGNLKMRVSMEGII